MKKKTTKGTEISKLKAAFRKTTEWHDFRENMIKEQKVDPITLKRLQKSANCHHMLLTNNIEEYKVLSNERQIMLNSKSHNALHWLYDYYIKDPEIIDRLKDLLDQMVKINQLFEKE